MADKRAQDKKQAEPEIKITRHADETVPTDALRSLQGSIGNAAVGRMLGARDKARDEKPTPVRQDTQSDIDAQTSGGVELGGGLREQMEATVGQDLGDVRIHRNAETDALNRRLGAKAFTQGRDVYLRGDRDLRSEEGQTTLAHELQHVAQGSVGAGAVLRDDDDDLRDEILSNSELAELISNRTHYGSAEVTRHEASGGEMPSEPTIRDPNAPPPQATPRTPQTFDIEWTIDNIKKVYSGLDAKGVVQAIKDQWQWLHRLKDTYRDWHQSLINNREDHPIVGFWADKLGNGNPPDIEIWNALGRHQLWEAAAAADKVQVNQTDAEIDKQYGDPEKAAGDTAIDRNLDIDLDRFDHRSMSPNFKHLKAMDKYDEKISYQVVEAAKKLQEAANVLEVRRKRVFYYKEGQIAGAERGITVVKTEIMVLSTVVGGEAFAAARAGGAGLIVSSGAAAGAGVLTSEAAEIGGQIGEMRYGDREWGDFDYTRIAKVGAKSAVTGFIGAVTGGKLSELVGGAFTKFAGPWLAEAGINLNNAGLKIVGGLFNNWITAAGSTPFSTTAGVLMDKAMGDKTVQNWGQFFDLVMHDMKTNVEMGTFIHMAGEAAKASNGTVPLAGEGPTSSGVPEPVAPEGDANVSRGTSNGVPEPIGPGTEPTQPAGPAYEPTAPANEVSTGVPEHIGPEGDANVAPGTSNGVPEPIGPGTEPTQPQGPAYEPTQPQGEVSTGVPEPIGPEGDANVEPGTSNGVPEPIGPGTEPTQPQGPGYEPTAPTQGPTGERRSQGEPENLPERVGGGPSSENPPLRMTPKALRDFALRILRRPLSTFGPEVNFHQTTEDFKAAWLESYAPPAPEGGGFFNPDTGELHLAPGADQVTAFHEVIHRVRQETNPLTRKLIGAYLDEGITELITRERIGPDATAHEYDSNVEFADFLMMNLGRGPMENAVIHGDYASFRQAVEARAGSPSRAFEVMRLLRSIPDSGDPVVEARVRELLGGTDIPEPWTEPVTREIPIADMQSAANEAERIYAPQGSDTAAIEAVVAEEFPQQPQEAPQEATPLPEEPQNGEEPQKRPPADMGDTQPSESPSSEGGEVQPMHPVVQQAVQEIISAMQDIGTSAVRDIAAELSDRALELTYGHLVVGARRAPTAEDRQTMLDAADEVMAEYWNRPGLPSARVSRSRP